MKVARSADGRVLDDERSRSGNGDDKPDQSREGEAAKRTELKPEGVRRTEVVDDGKGKDEDDCGERSQRNESDVDGAMELLPRTAVDASGEMRLVVATHLRREARDYSATQRGCGRRMDRCIDSYQSIA